MGDTNRVAMRFVKESVAGTTPATPNFETACHVGVTANAAPQTIESNKVCGGTNRGLTDLIKVGQQIGEGWNFELEAFSMDGLMEGVFQNTWTRRNRRVNIQSTDHLERPVADEITSTDTAEFVVASGTVFPVNALVFAKGFTNAANNGLFVVTTVSDATGVPVVGGLTAEASPPATAELHDVGYQGTSADITTTTTSGNALLSTTLNFTTLGLVPGQWIKLGGTAAGTRFATAVLNDWVRVSAVAAGRVDLDIVPAGWAIDAGTGKTIQLFLGDYITDAATVASFTLEEAFQDLATPSYQYFRGKYPEQYSLSGNAQEIVTGALTFIGLSQELTETRFAGAVTKPQPGNDSLQTASNVGRIAEGGSRLTDTYVISSGLNINNSGRRKNAWGVEGAADVGHGRFLVSGNLSVYFESIALAEKVQNNTESSYDVVFRDGDGQAMLFDVPRTKYATGVPTVGNRDEDVTLPLEFRGLQHATLGYTMLHQRFVYVAA